jgi:hypothetical protein
LKVRLCGVGGVHQSESAISAAISIMMRRRSEEWSTAPCKSPDTPQSPMMVATNHLVINKKHLLTNQLLCGSSLRIPALAHYGLHIP